MIAFVLFIPKNNSLLYSNHEVARRIEQGSGFEKLSAPVIDANFSSEQNVLQLA